MELKQRRIFNTNKFIIRDNGIEWANRNKFKYQNTFFEFEELNFKKSTKYVDYNIAYVILSISCTFCLIFSLFSTDENSALGKPTIVMFLILSIIFWVLLYLTKTNNIYIPTDRGISIVMYNGLPNKKKFSDYLIILKSEAKKTLIKKYFNRVDIDQNQLYHFMEEKGLVDESDKVNYHYKMMDNEIRKINTFSKN